MIIVQQFGQPFPILAEQCSGEYNYIHAILLLPAVETTRLGENSLPEVADEVHPILKRSRELKKAAGTEEITETEEAGKSSEES